MKEVHCAICNKNVKNDEIALNVKILGKQLGSIRCYDCLAAVMNCSTSKLTELSDYYKSSGCNLFKINYLQ
ncbi:hypothetical protein [Anaerocolumna sp.]|uniref:hypothetical protein n=1 Tax=Anaerocolumna sp. TaxID=2041569 RepID=UPI0028AD8C2E|nr:hypothetical protein [Anaerocolumna sp.]